MNITIKIECDNISELTAHLDVLKKQVKKEAKRLGLHPIHDELMYGSGKYLYDNNCYGTHEVKITNK